MKTTTKRISQYINSHQLQQDDIRDIAIDIIDSMVINKVITDCLNTENQQEFEAQDIIVEKLTELFNIQK
tara:strand:- start:258 stop:467 length:210 start_codon:yes stop_codon:yes gene_type:complete